jgi:hypothetical protein
MKSSDKIITDLTILGKAVNYVSGHSSEFPKEFTETEINGLNELVDRVHIHNGWFTSDNVKKALNGIATFLEKEKLESWSNQYDFSKNEKTVAIIMASNIPLVGFHDLLAVILSGNKALIKLSKDDNKLLPAIMNLFYQLDDNYKDQIKFCLTELKDFDAVIATGSDNTSRYFKQYFGSYPNIIRKNRTSIAIIDERTSESDLKELASDIFDYFGLGCRNVSKVFIPQDFELDQLFNAIYHKNDVVHHNKYANNYDYNKAIHLLNEDNLLDNGFVLLKESNELFSPLGMLFFQRYQDTIEVEEFIAENKDKIQAVVGHDHVGFGESQKPSLTDYADNIDVMKFLANLE